MTNWIIMPFIDNPEMTQHAIDDCLAQKVGVRLLLIDNGSREHPQLIAPSDAILWRHNPPLPSLSATWNRALDFVWEAGGPHALVVNNDVRLHESTYELLLYQLKADPAYFVSATGVDQDRWAETWLYSLDKGGPDFSCFLVSREWHTRYRFDEGFIPAFCEDLDMHRRMMLAGDGRKIYSVNVPFLHYGSATIKEHPEIADRVTKGSRQHYQRKWGGPVNGERYVVPFTPSSELGELSPGETVTTPDLQRAVWEEAE